MSYVMLAAILACLLVLVVLCTPTEFIQRALWPLKQYFERVWCLSVDTAFQTQYRQEYVAAFEQHQSLLRMTCTTEAVIKGNTAVFLVAGSGGATAVTRGVNGLIPARADDNTQNSCVMQEWHDLVRKTSFNIFASQGNQRAIMQMTSVAVVNRKVDSLIFTQLNNTTVTVGAASAQPNIPLFMIARVHLSNAGVPWDGNIAFCAGASFVAFLEEAPEFANAQYVDVKPYGQGDTNASWTDRQQAYRWRNCLIIEHPNIPGRSTTSEIAFLYHKNSIGHAADTSGLQSPVGYNEEQDYSFARATWPMGARLLQTTGVVSLTYDGTIYG